MLREHTKKTRVVNSTDDNVLEPDTFWTLIEKLLLRSSVDSQARNQHNLALSAMCRGRALPRLPRKLKGTSKEEKAKQCHANYTTNTKVLNKDEHTECNRAIPKTDKEIGIDRKSHINDTKKNADEVATATPTGQVNDAVKAKSECLLGDLDVVYVNDAKIPASERLWRYAMKHRKETSDTDLDNNDVDFIPTARSNEAIYHALKKRLEEALRENDKRQTETKKRTTKTRNGRKTNPKLCKSLDNTDKNAVKLKREVQKSTSLPIKPIENNFPQPPIKRRGQIPPKFLPQKQRIEKPVSYKPTNILMDETSNKHDEIESSKALYDCVLKKRLSCGNQLETMNKEIVYKKQNPRTIINRDTTKKYAELKNEYLNLCYQECNLRHQIAILHAEIYMMQNKGYHKTPASIKTINLDSKSPNIRPEMDRLESLHSTKNDASDVLLFPRLKAPKPLLIYPQKFLQTNDEKVDRKIADRQQTDDKDISDTEEQSDTPLPFISEGFPAHGVCSIYSLSPQLAPPPKRGPIMTIEAKISRDESMTKLSHRLPKMSTISLLKMANKT